MTTGTLSAYALAAEAYSRLLRGWLHDGDVTQDDLADESGTTQQKVSHWLSPKSALLPSIARVRLFPKEMARRSLSWAGEPHNLAVVEMPKVVGTADELRAIATAQRETSEAIAHGLDAMADGHITPAEGARLEKECDEAIAAFLVIRERARIAKAQGAFVLRSVPGGAA